MTISNNPPDMAVTAAETMQAISDWLEERPLITDEKEAREAKVLIDRGKLAIKDLEDERDGKVRPLNQQVKEINDYYRGPKENLKAVLDEISYRVTAFIRAEEARRRAIAEEARRKAEEAERIAREAEEARQVSLSDARLGVLDISVADQSIAAAEAAKDAAKMGRIAARADRDAERVRIAGGFSKAISLRQEITLEVMDAFEAIEVLGLTPDIEEAIIKSARAFYREHKVYPPGLRITEERKVK